MIIHYWLVLRCNCRSCLNNLWLLFNLKEFVHDFVTSLSLSFALANQSIPCSALFLLLLSWSQIVDWDFSQTLSLQAPLFLKDLVSLGDKVWKLDLDIRADDWVSSLSVEPGLGLLSRV